MEASELKARIELSAVVEEYLGPPAKAGGRWAFWRCPFHVDRKTASFGVTDDTGTWKCFGCGQTGDHLTFIMFRENVDFKGAMEVLRRLVGEMPVEEREKPRVRARPVATQGPPGEKWQESAWKVILYAERQLWSEAGEKTLAYLKGRGLDERTIGRWRLGWWPKARYFSPSLWGLERERDVWLPEGIVIPGIVGQDVWYLKFRTASGRPKYYNVPGGVTAMLGADRLQQRGTMLLCEGEMDFYLVQQEAGDLVDVATLGGAAKGHDQRQVNPLGRWLGDLMGYDRILVASDRDAAGELAGKDFEALTRRAEWVLPPHGGDLGEFVQAGGKLREWVAGLLGLNGNGEMERKAAEGYPVFLTFGPEMAVGLPAGNWWRLEDGRLEAMFERPEELADVVWVMRVLCAA